MTKKFAFLNTNGGTFPDWEQKTLGEVTMNNPPKYDPLKSKEECRSIELENLNGGGSGIINGWFNSLEQKSTKNVFKAGDILLGKLRPYLKKWAKPDFAGVCSTEIWVLTSLNDSISNNFLYALIQSPRVQQNLIDITSGTKMPRADWKSVASTKLEIPSLPEQEKIAEFFSALDERIELVDNKVRLLKEQKKGYLQRIFAQEMVFTDDNGDTFPEWEQKKLGEVAKIIMGQSPDGNSYSEDSSNTVLIQGNADMKNGHVIPRIYTSAVTKTCAKGDIIMSVRAPVGALAKTNIDACIGRGVCAIRGNDFVYHFLQYHQESGGWKKIAQGSTFEAVSSIDVNRLLIPLPSLPEQEKIAEFFSALDEQIELNENKLELLKEQKKGYLQGIFG